MKHSITVRLSQLDQPGIELLELLEGLLPVAFERSEWGGNNDTNMVVFETARRSSTNGGGVEKVKLTLPKGAINPASISLTETPVAFSDALAAPFPFRGTKLKVKLPSEVPALSPMAGETVLASTPSGPVWAASTDQGLRHIRSSLPLPSLAADGMLQQVLNADRFLEMLPLLEFLHETCGDDQFARPPLRACFMFDDPNLHWPRYGFVDFKDIAARAARGNYHVSFATVPMDGWFTHPRAARLFQSHPEQLSLLVHGNDHVHDELARDNAPEQRVALLRQAIHRIERLERVTGCEISRVMVAPHGACSEAMLQEMPGCGFESAAISHGSLRAHNKGKPWTRGLGYLPSEIIRGCPVLPRWGMTGNTANTIRLAAYLGQPMILRGHHADLRNGAELLDELGGVINGLGRVRWGNMTELSRMNYQVRLDRETVRIKPGGLKLDVSLPRGARRLAIEAHSAHTWNHWLCTRAGSEALTVNVGEEMEIPDGCERVSLTAAITPVISSGNGDSGLPFWPFLRRLLTEGRDRLQSVSR